MPLDIVPSPNRGESAPRFDVPILASVGAWVLLFSWDIGDVAGLAFPGLIGWVLLLVASLRALTGRLRAGSMSVQDRRLMRRLWLGCGLGFAMLAGAELFLSRWMPDSWRAAAIHMLHIRRVYRQYGP